MRSSKSLLGNPLEQGGRIHGGSISSVPWSDTDFSDSMVGLFESGLPESARTHFSSNIPTIGAAASSAGSFSALINSSGSMMLACSSEEQVVVSAGGAVELSSPYSGTVL